MQCVWGHYLVESYVCLVHQINIELADKSPELLWVSEWLSLLHGVTNKSHNCMLKTHTHTNDQQKTEHHGRKILSKNIFRAPSGVCCSDLHLFLEGKVSPRDIKRSH